MMELSGRIAQRLLLFSLVALIVPMVVFPAHFGVELAQASLLNVMYELIFYGLVVFLFHRRSTLLQLVEAAGICLVYRLALGAIFGVVIAAWYSLNLTIALSLGMSGYLPAVLFQIAVTPFILIPVTDQLYRRGRPARERPAAEAVPEAPEKVRTATAVPRHRGSVLDSSAARPVASSRAAAVEETARDGGVPVRHPSETNGFERAVRYIGEHGSVHLAAVVDAEGLLMAGMSRGGAVAEEWSPLALLFLQCNDEVLRRGDFGESEKLDIALADQRVSVARCGDFCLMVVAERQQDDVLNIRIHQALDIIEKYVAERYGRLFNHNAEKVHVSGT